MHLGRGESSLYACLGEEEETTSREHPEDMHTTSC